MRAIVLRAAGGPEQLVFEHVATPTPGRGEALVRVHAAALTRGELEWPVDRLPAIPSYELSGVVVALGPGVADVAIGDEVYGMTAFDRDGVAADYAAIATELLAPKPHAMTHAEAAAAPLAALSAWQGLFDQGRLIAAERVLIHGATGGVGQFATPLAKRHGAHVIATTSSRGVERARELGADTVIDHTLAPWDATIEPVDLVFDTAGGERLARSPGVLREGGRLVSIAEEPPQATGYSSVYFVVEPNRHQLAQLAELFDGGLPPPAIDSVFALEEAASAFERSMAADKRGKVVLEMASAN
ncbi:MAG TPA: NADP-dependent oxidoreductase [Solirubrobacteraceae bacterium]|nr:NADP-dependent oxidoreductase [Solirubrobacteraceae bacterium]